KWGHYDVATLGAADQTRRIFNAFVQDLVDPRAGGIDYNFGGGGVIFSGEQIREFNAADIFLFNIESIDTSIGENCSAVSESVECVLQDKSLRKFHLGIEIGRRSQ